MQNLDITCTCSSKSIWMTLVPFACHPLLKCLQYMCSKTAGYGILSPRRHRPWHAPVIQTLGRPDRGQIQYQLPGTNRIPSRDLAPVLSHMWLYWNLLHSMIACSILYKCFFNGPLAGNRYPQTSLIRMAWVLPPACYLFLHWLLWWIRFRLLVECSSVCEDDWW